MKYIKNIKKLEVSMKLIEYKRNHDGTLAFLEEKDGSNMRINHVYEGKIRYVDDIESGSSICFVKKEDVQSLKESKDDITLYSVRMKERYVGEGSVSLSHSIGSYANGLLIDEMKSIVEQYPNDEYWIIAARILGQFFEYSGVEGTDYTLVASNPVQSDVSELHISFFNAGLKEYFTEELSDGISVNDVVHEINALTISESVLFIHHENGVGYAARNMELLSEISGYVYQNYLIKE